MKSIFADNLLLIFRLINICEINSLGFCIGSNQFLAMQYIFFFQFAAEPLVNLVLRLRALDNFQPVTARSLGILRSNDFDT